MYRFQDIQFDKSNRFSLGKDIEAGDYYLSIPVANSMADYEEYYRITPDQFELFKMDLKAAKNFASQCRKQELDYLLILPPGTDRGVAS
jgi:hypothetical protein